MLISKNEARQKLAMSGIIPSEWTEEIEDVETTDLKEIRERLLDTTEIAKVAYQSPNEPIVLYSYNTQAKIKNSKASEEARRYISKFYYPPGKLAILWNSGSEIIKNRYW